MSKEALPWTYCLKKFDALSLEELYEILQLRQLVFIIEQNCPYLDCDDKDQKSLHLMYHSVSTAQLIAYARLLPPGCSYPNDCSIGRVVSHTEFRALGLGRELMQQAIHICSSNWPSNNIRISAQCYLIKFYESFGFVCVGESYLEDDIPHIEMLREAYNGLSS